VITSTAYSYHSGCVAIGDDQGVLSIWRLHIEPHRVKVRHQPVVMIAPVFTFNSRIYHIKITPSGERYIVALYDRLYLLAMDINTTRSTHLYIHTVLDRLVII
jgi:hypothetical protein